jgi:peptidoglycan/LPS O-acetylase OafA/YrhL
LVSLGKTIGSRENNYNSIRFFLAASVIYFHSFALTKAAGYIDYPDSYLQTIGLSVGGLAVDCFFFLSGVFVTQSFYRDQSPINFTVRRFCRIWPGLFVCVAVTAVIACILTKGWGAWMYLFEPGFYGYVIPNSKLSLVWEIPGVFQNRPYAAINGAIHTLPTEAKMYVIVLCAGAVTLFRRRRTILIAGIVILAATLLDYGFFVKHLAMPDYGQPPMAMFFAGVALFAVADYVKVKWWHVVVCIGLAVATPRPWSTTFGLAASASAMIVVGHMKWGWRPRSDVSYGIYIYGWPCQQFIVTFFPHLNPYALSGSALLLAWGFAALSWRLVEKPAIVFGQGLTAMWTEFRSRGGFSNAGTRLLSLAALPRFATVCVIFLLCVGMGWASERLNVSPISPLDTTITSFGPTETKAGHGFNVQPSGASAIWVKFDKPPPQGTRIVFDGRPLDTTLGQDSATAAVPNALFASAGDKPVLLEFRGPGQRQRSAPVMVRVTN